MNTLRVALLITAVSAITSQDTVNKTEPVLPEPKTAFKFEDQPDQQQSYGLVKFEPNNRFQQFDDQNSIDHERQRIKFEENNIKNQRPNHQKKKRRRRPKQGFPNGASQNDGGARYPGSYPGSTVYPGPQLYPGPMYGLGPVYSQPRPFPVSYPGSQYKPRPSLPSTALSAVTEALTSIALYDDAQCVPRLLCEAAGGTGSVPGAGLLQSIAGLQPLLTLLSAYNGISSSPLFVFGRAVFLGMTSKANPGTCRYAYNQCPNDPEQLVHYLNNHNGGFFRFFAAPELNQQQGLEQFYNQLSGQNYGFYQPQQNAPLQHGQNSQQGYGLQYQNHNPYVSGQGLGQYQNQNVLQQSAQNPLYQFGQGVPQQQHQYQRPSPYGNGYGLYGQTYPYQQNLNHNYFKNKEMQKRILNAQDSTFSNNVKSSKWSFPEDSNGNKITINDNVRLGKVLKFPQNNVNSITAAEGFIFPGIQSNRQYPLDSFESIDSDSYLVQNVNDFSIYNQQNFDSGDGFNEDTRNQDGVKTLYIVRGNGDPNHPEIVHLAPGDTL